MGIRPPHDRDDSTPRSRSAEERERLAAHRGHATWGERLVPLDEFREAVRRSGRALDPASRRAALGRFLAPVEVGEESEGPFERIVAFGGIYNNHLALEALLEEAQGWGAEAVYCLGDFGGFGPCPEKAWPLLEEGGVRSIQGNYEESLAGGAEDCNCGYADPRDNHFAELSYRYTAENCSAAFRRYMGALPPRRRLRLGDRELLLVHGSPRRINEFLFESTTPDPYLEVLLDQQRCDGLLFTHTGLPWQRTLASGRLALNVGVIGRPANDGDVRVRYARLEARDDRVHAELVPLAYDHESLAGEMRREKLPEEFVDTILTGWWTTCLEVLPASERAASRF